MIVFECLRLYGWTYIKSFIYNFFHHFSHWFESLTWFIEVNNFSLCSFQLASQISLYIFNESKHLFSYTIIIFVACLLTWKHFLRIVAFLVIPRLFWDKSSSRLSDVQSFQHFQNTTESFSHWASLQYWSMMVNDHFITRFFTKLLYRILQFIIQIWVFLS